MSVLLALLGAGLAAVIFLGTRVRGGVGVAVLVVLICGAVFFLSRPNSELDPRAEAVLKISGVEGFWSRASRETSSAMWEPLKSYRTVSALGRGMGSSVRTPSDPGEAPGATAEWNRLLSEGGYLWGTALILLRISLAIFLFYWAYRMLGVGNLLSGGLFLAVFPWVLVGSWANPAVLGFMGVTSGFVLAATRPRCNDSTMLTKAAASIPQR
jgi:hypothetical protein